MHIVYICADPGIPVFGSKGGSIHVQEVLHTLLRKGHQTTLIYARAGGEKPERLAGLSCIQLPELPGQDDIRFSESASILQGALKSAIEMLQPIDIVYERYSLWSYGAIEAAHLLGIKSCLEVNAHLIYEQGKYRKLTHPELAHQCFNKVFSNADTIYAVSNGVKSQLVSAGIHSDHVHVVHNGVDTERFKPVAKSVGFGNTVITDPALTIGFCGSLKPWHGVDGLIDAFAMHHLSYKHSKLVIIGDGPERVNIEQRIQMHHLSNSVEMIGSVIPEKVPQAIGRVNVAVAPYPNLDNMYFSPLKIFEYLALGICTVAPRIGDIPNIIEHDVSGILYEAGDVSELATVLDQLVVDGNRVRRIANAGRDLAVQRYTWDRVVDKVIAITLKNPRC